MKRNNEGESIKHIGAHGPLDINITQHVGNRIIQQWVVWKESVANCKRCKAITNMYFSEVGVWSKSGFKGLFSKLKRINSHMQTRGPDLVYRENTVRTAHIF